MWQSPDPTQTPTLQSGLSLSLQLASLYPSPLCQTFQTAFDLLRNVSDTRLPLQRSTDTGQLDTVIQVPPEAGLFWDRCGRKDGRGGGGSFICFAISPLAGAGEMIYGGGVSDINLTFTRTSASWKAGFKLWPCHSLTA